MVQRVMQTISFAVNRGVKTAHLLFQSGGGTVGDGVLLYNFFKIVPLDFYIYNGGTVASIAVIAFLGAEHRYASAHSSFMIHRSYANSTLFTSAAAANATRLRSIARAVEIDDTRTRAILRANLNLSDDCAGRSLGQ